MTLTLSTNRSAVLTLTTALAIAATSGVLAQDAPSLGFYGTTGLIDMPTGESQPDGMINGSSAHFGPISRNTLTFQITPRLSGSFRYQAVRDFNRVRPSAYDTYFDRNFDLRYQVLRESQYVPALAVGLQDFIGTGLFSAEYIVATKNLTPDLKVTAGLGWGRLGSYGSIGSVFGDRPPIDIGRGGKPNVDQWFKGPAAPFGGVEYQINDNWTLKAEYSSDAYVVESETRQTFDRKSPFNFGVEYSRDGSFQVGAYYLYGSEIGMAAHFFINPKQRPTGSIAGGAPDHIEPRPSRSVDPDAWSPEWVTQAGIGPILMTNINKRLEKDGIVVEGISYTGSTATVLMRNDDNDSEAQAIGRVARAMTHVMPASVEVFEIVPVVEGMAASKATIRRSDLEQLDYVAGATEAMRERTSLTDVGPNFAGMVRNEDLYPKFTWGINPYVRTRLFNPDEPVRGELGLRFSAAYDVAPGFTIAGSVTKSIAGNLGEGEQAATGLPRVRTDGLRYDRQGDPALETLTLAYYRQLSPNLYGRVTVGYLERMFGGVSTEVLWKKVDSPLALGVEVNYVKKRDFDLGLGFRDYDVLTGHVSAYYTFGPEDNYEAQLDVGRYLAGDYGATLSLDRTFENGWKVGAFATITDVPAEAFGEGSFDKGIKLEIPANWFLGTPSRKTTEAILRPLTKDGGARLKVDGRLNDLLRDYQQIGVDQQWGRFWK